MIQVDEALRILREAWASNGDYLDDLKERLTGSQPIPLVPFVGAGLSMPLGFPSWDGFLTRLAAECRDNPAHISEQVRAEVGGEERLAVVDGKDDMGEEVGKGVSHRLSPPWGSHILTQLLVPRLTPWSSRRGASRTAEEIRYQPSCRLVPLRTGQVVSQHPALQ